MNLIKEFLKWTILLGLALASLATVALADPDDTWHLVPDAQVDSSGIYLDQIVVPPAAHAALPHTRLAPAPTLNQTVSISRSHLTELAQTLTAELITTNWSGVTCAHVSRRTRQFSDSDMLELLTASLQRDFVRERGELQLRLDRPFNRISVPDEPLTLKVSDLPAIGVTPTFIATCELWCGKELVGTWSLGMQASVWRDVPVAHSLLHRDEPLKDADIGLERRDVLLMPDVFLNYPPVDDSTLIAQNVQPEAAILNRFLRPRPVIERGHLVEGVFKDGALSISLKVEALEDGLIGQTVRVRNPKTKRELYGKVQNEQTVLIAL